MIVRKKWLSYKIFFRLLTDSPSITPIWEQINYCKINLY